MITSVMYHYVRPVENSQLRYLSLEDFTQQLDWLESFVGRFLTEDEWEDAKIGKVSDGVILTFDDGLRDHIDYVLPVLKERGIFAIFFVSSAPLISHTMLPVHLTHKLLSLGRSAELVNFFHERLPSKLWRDLDIGVAASAYTKHKDLDENIAIKKIVNYLFSAFDLGEILNFASKEFLSTSLSDLSSSWYLSSQDVKSLVEAGMKIGSHANTHRLLPQLDEQEIISELSESKRILESIIESEVNEFCYPYGGPHSYNRSIQQTLAKLNYAVAHDVSPRPISKKDFDARFALPRYNCNELPFGIAHSLKGQS